MAVPTIFQMWRDSESFARVDLSSTRMALCGGAPCPLPLIDAYRERGVLFRQGYGLTEVGPNCFSLTPEDTFRKAGSVGWPNFYLQTKIVDDAGQPVPTGEVGELALGGPMVTLGYFRNAEATAQAFRGTRFFHTGDLVRRDDEGYHYIVDRKKDMFISGGENIYPAEVELALAALERRGRIVRHRRARRALGRSRPRRRRRRARHAARRRRRAHASRRAAGALQDPEVGRLHRCAAAQLDRQGVAPARCASDLALDMRSHNCYCAFAS